MDPYAQAGFYLAFFSAVVAVRKARKAPETPSTWQRSPSNLHGNSDWMPMSIAHRMFQTGGIIIGEAYRPDNDSKLGGQAPLLRYDGKVGSGHCLVFAGSGGYKTTGVGIPCALEWSSALVYLDPSAEVFPIVRAAREALGHRVISLNPEDGSGGFNVLDWIDTSTDRSLMDIQAVVAWLAGEQPAERYDDYFKHAARALLGCLLADILFAPGLLPEEKTLALLRKRVALPIPELRQLLEDIYAKGDSYGFGFPAQLAGNLKDITEKQFSGFYGEAGNLTAWLAVPSLARLVCGSSFETRDLLSGKLDVFINVPLKVLQSNPQVCRLILGALLNAAYEARGDMDGRILFLLDEVARLGYMGILETARDAGRKYGINLLLMYQSLGQMTGHLGPAGAAGVVRFVIPEDVRVPSRRERRGVSVEGLRRIHGGLRGLHSWLRHFDRIGDLEEQQHPRDDQRAAACAPADQARRDSSDASVRRADCPHFELPSTAMWPGDLLPQAGNADPYAVRRIPAN